jgi:ribosomal protein S18 acetylase RimI-like enzyme
MTHDAPRHVQRFAPPIGQLPLGLRADGITCRVRAWPGRDDIAQLVFHQQARLPTAGELDRWCHTLADAGFGAVRTTAVAGAAAPRFDAAGFDSVQELVLLQFDEPRRVPPPTAPIRRLSPAQHTLAADLDRAAFGDDWALDAAAIADVCVATPRFRARTIGGLPMTAYAISGRDARQGFLQRLAVSPEAQRAGLGRSLVFDSLRWAARWRVDRVLVNTHTANRAALALYEGVGFHRLAERLHVFERSLHPDPST